MSNLHYTFYKEYYQYLETKDSDNGPCEDSNNKIINYLYKAQGRPSDRKIPGCVEPIRLWTKYPGLLTGIGMPHYLGRNNDEINLGFSFDYVTGLPCIPGSTVKGCLRQAFTGKKMVYVCDALQLSAEYVKELGDKIFGHAQEDSDSEENGSDIFFDAQIVSGAEDGKILDMDKITPHKGPVSDPDIINILKIRPNVRFEFQFKLTDTKLSNGTVVTAGQKRTLFESILMDFGIGAKTNVGYGILSKDKTVKFEKNQKQQESVKSEHINSRPAQAKTPKTNPAQPKTPQPKTLQIDSNTIYTGHVIEVTSAQIRVKIEGQDLYPKLKKNQMTKDGLQMSMSKLTEVFQLNDNVAITFSNDNPTSAKLEYKNQTEDIQKKLEAK